VVQPDRLEPSLWHVMTGWGSTRREILTFRETARSLIAEALKRR
jgi:hypothetical protein